MGVLHVNVGDAVTPDWREIGCGGSATGPDWIAYQTYTVPTAAGLRSITFASPITLVPGVDYWYVMQNNAANAQAQGTTDASDTFTNISVTAGMFYSNSGGGFGSSSSVLFPIFGTTASSGTAPQLGYSGGPSNYWGPTSIAQKFRVTSTVTVTGLTQYWGGNAGLTGKWGIARSLSATSGRLKLWDGTRWMREVCTADTGTGPNLLTANQNGLETGATTGWAAQPDPGFGTVFTVISTDTTHAHTGTYSLKVSTSAAIDRYFATPAGTSGFAVTPGTSYEVSAFVWRSDLSDASRLAFDVRWYNSSGSLLSTSTGFLTYITPREAWEPVDFGAYTAPAGAVYGQLYGHTSSANNLTITYWLDDIVIGANVERHPLKMWDGTTWQTVTCMTPA